MQLLNAFRSLGIWNKYTKEQNYKSKYTQILAIGLFFVFSVLGSLMVPARAYAAIRDDSGPAPTSVADCKSKDLAAVTAPATMLPEQVTPQSVNTYVTASPMGGGTEHTSSNTTSTASKEQSQNPCTNVAGASIFIDNGNKTSTVTEFSVPVEMGLKFERIYNSNFNSSLTGAWTTNLDFNLSIAPVNGGLNIYYQRPDGAQLKMYLTNDNSFVDTVGTATLTRASGGYVLHDEDANVLTFDAQGRLLTIKDTSGVGWTITHTGNPGSYPYTTTVTHTNGQFYTISDSAPDGSGNRQVIVKDPSLNTYTYSVTNTSTMGLVPVSYMGLIHSVTYPGSPSEIVSYKYQNPTGILYANELTETDINGVPYSLTTYDSNGYANMTSLADGSEKLSTVYNNSTYSRIIGATQTNALGRVENYTYTNNGAAPGHLNFLSKSASIDSPYSNISYTYDPNGHMSTSEDDNGNIIHYVYEDNGLLFQKSDAVHGVTDYTWDTTPGVDRPLVIQLEGWYKKNYVYDGHNRVTSISVTNLSGVGTGNQTLTTTYGYTLYANGMVHTMTVTSPSPNNSAVVTSQYDTYGNLVSQSDGLGHTTTYSNYNALGEVGEVVGPNGDATDYTYDGRGRILTKTMHPYGFTATWQYNYDGFGELSSLTGPDGESTTWNRDAEMRVTTITRNDKDGTSTESFAYDANNDVTGDTIARGGVVGFQRTATYDALARVYQQKGSNGQVLTYAYDGNGNVLSVTDALGHAITSQFDAANRHIRVTDALSGVTQYSYDVGDNVTKVIDPRGLVTTYAYDGLGQFWQQVSPDTGTTNYVYDSYGRTASMTRADGVQTTYGYDALNRRISVSASGQTQSFSYDICTNGKGLLCSASDATGTTSYSYTPEGWMSGRGFSIGGTTYALGYNYDNEGRQTVVTYPDGNEAVYWRTHGVVNSVLLVVSGAYYNGATNVTYQPADMAMASWSSSNGLVNTLGYDTDGRLTSISVPGIQNQSFGYDVANRITHIGNGIDSSMTETLGYDATSRVASMSSGAENESYQYDADGNRVSAVISGISETFTPDVNSNRMVSAYNPYFGTVQYGFDAQGNSTSTNGLVSQQYNPFNRLTQSGGATFYINPEGQRLRKAGGSTGTTYFAPDPSGDLLAESDNGTWVDYVRLNGRLIGRISGGQIDAIHADQVDRPDTVTDASQNVIWHAKNYPFGSTVTLANISLNLGFPGQYYDAETWLWNNGYRDYNSGFGRYIESDPAGLSGGINTYAYVGNNPLNSTDPLGLRADTDLCAGMSAHGCMQMGQFGPDYVTYNVTVPSIFEFGGTITRGGTVFHHGGLTFGSPKSIASGKNWGFNLSIGNLLKSYPVTNADINGLVGGVSKSAGFYDVVGGGVVHNGSGTAIEIGVGFGGGSVGVSDSGVDGQIGPGLNYVPAPQPRAASE